MCRIRLFFTKNTKMIYPIVEKVPCLYIQRHYYGMYIRVRLVENNVGVSSIFTLIKLERMKTRLKGVGDHQNIRRQEYETVISSTNIHHVWSKACRPSKLKNLLICLWLINPFPICPETPPHWTQTFFLRKKVCAKEGLWRKKVCESRGSDPFCGLL